MTREARGPRGAPGGRHVLVIDTATSRVVVARGELDGQPGDVRSWPAGHRHGESLLPAVEQLLEPVGGRAGVGAIAVGTGPGAFTGLRVGIATAKGLAHGLGCPLVGIPTGVALLAAAAAAATEHAAGHLVLLLPAGPADRVLVRSSGRPELLPGGAEPDLGPGARLVAVDLDGRAPDDAVELGRLAHEGLGAALLGLATERLARGELDDLAELVPEYVTLPRGVHASSGEVAWSRDPR